MMTVVPTIKEDLELAVVRFTAKMSWPEAGPEEIEAKVSEAQEYMIAGRWVDLALLMVTSANLVFSIANDKELECIFTIICELVKKPENVNESVKIAKLLSNKIAQQPNEKPAQRLKILLNLHNMLEDSYGRFLVYMKALEVAANGNVSERITRSFKKIDTLLKEWNLELKDQRKLYLAISNILKEQNSSAKENFKFLTKYLATFNGEDADGMDEAKEQAAYTIIEFVKASDMFQCDLLGMPAIAQLEKDAKYASIHQLLKIFVTQRLNAYLEFHTTNSAVLESYGLVHEDCVAKMRLMSLVDLASDAPANVAAGFVTPTKRTKKTASRLSPY